MSLSEHIHQMDCGQMNCWSHGRQIPTKMPRPVNDVDRESREDPDTFRNVFPHRELFAQSQNSPSELRSELGRIQPCEEHRRLLNEDLHLIHQLKTADVFPMGESIRAGLTYGNRHHSNGLHCCRTGQEWS